MISITKSGMAATFLTRSYRYANLEIILPLQVRNRRMPINLRFTPVVAHPRCRKTRQIYASPEGALTFTRELGCKGFMFWLTDPLDGTAAQDFLKILELEDKT
jgi:hypothetical protein